RSDENFVDFLLNFGDFARHPPRKTEQYQSHSVPNHPPWELRFFHPRGARALGVTLLGGSGAAPTLLRFLARARPLIDL
ncbi:MAG: hypothetical protein ABR970_23065, partial [Roseiarcus sp.]